MLQPLQDDSSPAVPLGFQDSSPAPTPCRAANAAFGAEITPKKLHFLSKNAAELISSRSKAPRGRAGRGGAAGIAKNWG